MLRVSCCHGRCRCSLLSRQPREERDGVGEGRALLCDRCISSSPAAFLTCLLAAERAHLNGGSPPSLLSHLGADPGEVRTSRRPSGQSTEGQDRAARWAPRARGVAHGGGRGARPATRAGQKGRFAARSTPPRPYTARRRPERRSTRGRRHRRHGVYPHFIPRTSHRRDAVTDFQCKGCKNVCSIY